MIFEKIQNQLEANQFEIVSKDHNRPWGGFFVIAEEQAQQFANRPVGGRPGGGSCGWLDCGRDDSSRRRRPVRPGPCQRSRRR